MECRFSSGDPAHTPASRTHWASEDGGLGGPRRAARCIMEGRFSSGVPAHTPGELGGPTTPGGTLYNDKPPDAPDRSPTALTACGRLGASLASGGSIMRRRKTFKTGRSSMAANRQVGSLPNVLR